MPEPVSKPFDVQDIPIEDRFPGWPHVGGGAPDEGGSADDAGGDTFVPDGADGGAGDGDGGDGDPGDDVDIQSVADEFDAQALAEMGDHDDGADPEVDEGTGAGKKAARRAPATIDSALQDFIDKNYDGNVTAFLAAQHTSRQEAKRLAEENRTLKERMSRPAARKPDDLKAVIDADADVQALNQRIATRTNKINTLSQRQGQIAADAPTINNKIATLEAELPFIDDQKEHTRKMNELGRLRSDLSALVSEFQSNQTEINVNGDKLEDLQDKLRSAKRQIELELEDEETTREEEQERNARTVQTFSDAFDAVIAPFKLDPKSEKYRYVRESTRTQLADYLDSLGAKARGLQPIDIYNNVGKLVGIYARAHGMKPQSGKPGTGGARPTTPHQPPTRRLVVPGRNGGDGQPGARTPRTPAAPRTHEDVLSDPDRVRARAAHIGQAIARQHARRGGVA